MIAEFEKGDSEEGSGGYVDSTTLRYKNTITTLSWEGCEGVGVRYLY
jgi:hypothetical protein